MILRKLWRRLEANAFWFQLFGLVTVLLWQFRLWRLDQQRLEQVQLLEPPDLPSDTPKPLVSILLPAWNEGDNIDACLQSILALRYPNKQVIVCAGGQDDTLARACQYANDHTIVIEQQPGEGKQRALRRSYDYARGTIIFLTDADCVLDDDTFERTLAPLLTGEEKVSTGSWRPLEGQETSLLVRYQWSHHLYRELWAGEYIASLDGRNTAISRTALENVGAFDLEVPIGTDYVLSRQLEAGGYPIRFVRGSRVHTEYPQTVTTYWKQLSRWFRNPLILGWQWGDKSLAMRVIWNGVTSLLLLLSFPLSTYIRTRILRGLWLLAVAHLWASACRTLHLLIHFHSLHFCRIDYMRLLYYLPIGWIALVLGLRDSLWHRKRTTW